MFKENKEKTKGITLIALVVTVVILVILASISINLVLNGGLINRSQSGKELHELQREKERLELIKGEVASDTNHVGKVTVDTYVEELINQGITTEGETTDNGDGSKTVITDTGYSVLIEPKGEKDVEIIIEGKAGQLPPRIKKVELERDEEGTKLTVKVDAVRAEGATYKYYYKTVGGEYGESVYTGESASFTIEDISKEEIYTVKVEVTNEFGTAIKIVSEPLKASKLKGATYVWYIDANGEKRKCAVLNGEGDGEQIEIVTVEPVETLNLGAPTSNRAGANVGKGHFDNLKSILGGIAEKTLNSSLSSNSRTLFGRYDKSIKSVKYSGWQNNIRNCIKFDWDRLIALNLNRNYWKWRNLVPCSII